MAGITDTNTLKYVISIIFDKLGARDLDRATKAVEKEFKNMDEEMKKLNPSFKLMSSGIRDVSVKTKTGTDQLAQLWAVYGDGKGKTMEVSKNLEQVKRSLKEVDGSMEASSKTVKEHGQNYAQLALRAISVIPIWMTLRAIFGTVQKLITDSVATWIDLSKEMARVGSTGFEAAKNIELLKSKILDFSQNSSRGFKEVASAMYQLGSAGLTVSEMIQGMPHIMNLAIASFADTEQTAKLVAGAYNVFSESITEAVTSEGKFKYISDVLAYTYAKQQVELDDLGNAMSYVASAAGMMHIDFNTLVTTIGVLNTGMLRGSKAGVALMNSFIQIAQESSKLSQLGVTFDPTKPLEFTDVVDQLHNRYGDAALSLTNLKEIMDVFGQRGGRAMAQLISDYDRWRKSINNAKADYKDFAADMARVAEISLPAAWEKMWNSMKANMIQILGGTEGWLTKVMSNAGKGMERGAFFREYEKYMTLQERAQHDDAALSLTNLIGGTSEKTGAELDALKKQVEQRVYLIDAMKQGIIAAKAQEGYNKESLQTVMSLEDLGQKAIDNKMTESQITTEIVRLLQTIPGFEALTGKAKTATIEKLKEQLKLQKQLKEESLHWTITEERGFRERNRAAQYEIMRAAGVKDSAIEYSKLQGIIYETNEFIELANKAEDTLVATKKKQKQEYHDTLTIEQMLGNSVSDYLLKLKQVGGADEYIIKLDEQRLKLVQQIAAENLAYAKQLRDDFSGIFKDILLGEEEVGNVFTRLGDKIRDSIAESMATSFSTGLINTGIGEAFGMAKGAFENMFTGPYGLLSKAIVDGSTTGSAQFPVQIVAGSVIGSQMFYDKIVAASKGEPSPSNMPPPSGPGGGAGTVVGTAVTDKQKALAEEILAGSSGESQGKAAQLLQDAKQLLSGASTSNASNWGPAAVAWAEKILAQTKQIEDAVATGAEKGTVKAGEKTAGVIGDKTAESVKAGLQSLQAVQQSMGISGGGGTTSSGAPQFFTQGLFGALAPAMGQAVPQLNKYNAKTGKYENQAGGNPLTYGNLFGGAVSGALMGYSQYGSMTQRGASPGYAGMAGGLTGAGTFLTSMGMASGMFPLAGVGMIMTAAGFLMDVFKKGKTTTTVKEETKTEQKQVTSRIDVTNKQLELVNRNLIALKDELTYIMQSSYYFRERNLEDRYAIDAQRGNM